MDNPIQRWLLAVLKRRLGVRDTTPSWCIMRECGLQPLQFNWFRAAMRHFNSPTCRLTCNWARALLIVDPSMLCNPWFGTPRFPAVFCLPNKRNIDFSLFVVDLRIRHLHYWERFSSTNPRKRNSRHLTNYQRCAPSKSGSWLRILLTLFPNTCSLTSPMMSFAAWLEQTPHSML